MENRVYYGQYSLNHWLDLILKQNIVLPNYQRYFVWNQSKVETLIETFKNKEFVPPISIGAFKNGGSTLNYILDGQQRLTSILLAYLSLYPDKAFFKSSVQRLADENDDEIEEIEERMDDVLHWDFSNLTARGRSREEIQRKLEDGNYKPVNFQVNEAFFKKTFLGFSYIVPQSTDPQEQQKFYSSVFRNINIQGERLLPQESRASLYFLNKDLEEFFDPAFVKEYKVRNQGVNTSADFVRYLSLLFQYAKVGISATVASGYKLKMEKYYETFIYSVVGDKPSLLFKTLVEIFPDSNYHPRFEQLKQNLEALEILKLVNSIIDMDMYLFGLIYQVVFMNRNIDAARKDELKAALEAMATVFRNDPGHKKAPGALKYLRARIDGSIGIYNSFLL